MSTIQAQRVVIFGREGLAREQLVTALSEFGVTPVWVGKPIQSNPEKLSELNPNQIIISLEPMIESELLPYSEFLSQSQLSVMYDDAESTRHLSGWDLNRWARHMASKLLNQDYMPPTLAAEKQTKQEDLSIETKGLSSNQLSIDVEAAIGLSVESSSSTMDKLESDDAEVQSFDWQSTDNYDALDINPSELSAALDKLNQNLSNNSNEAVIREMDYEQLIPLTDSELLEFESQPDAKNISSENNFDFQLEDTEDTKINSFNTIQEKEITNDEEPIAYMDEAALKLAESSLNAQLANSGSNAYLNSKLELQTSETDNLEVAVVSEAKTKPREFDLSMFSLVDDEDDGKSAITADVNKIVDTVKVHEQNPTSERSLFLVVSGVGGPGVVRSIVSKVKSNFSGIVVLSQDIEIGQLPKFLIQLQKVVKIPVAIPISEEYLKSGNIYLIPDKFTVQLTALGYQCVSYGNLTEFIAQADQNVEIVILSGANATLAQSLIQVSSVMSNIYVQPPEECFDATLPQLLVNMGVPVIRQDILDTWFN
jgi:chemotaxis response regulator CheB